MIKRCAENQTRENKHEETPIANVASPSENSDSKISTSKVGTSDVKKPSAAQTRRDVFARAGSACENCGSTFALEIDHIHPKALGGSSDAENLRVLCRACNQRAAIQVFGVDKMGEFL
jgi:5-methylcytosine-specific restriction endonuclease McrA